MNLVQIVYGAKNATFQDCYDSYSWNDKTPDDAIYTTNICNFYHEKTGQWFTEEDWNTPSYSTEINKYWPEFYQKYSDQADSYNRRSVERNFYNFSSLETSTFNDCYADTAVGMMFIADINTTDSQINQLIKNLCNFYHEKTGIWITHKNWFDEEMKKKYANEFYLKYRDSIPDKLKQLFD